jgi:SAM-dependent methyltransferase
MDFSKYDTRHYPTVPVREGYGEWARTYEQIVQDEMDLRLFSRMRSVAWAEIDEALDLACGTGRIGAWLRGRGVRAVDGVDLTPEMMAQAKEKGVYRRLLEGDITATGLPAGAYALLTQSLADEHLAELDPLYREARRLLRPGGRFALVGYHPFFLMSGIPTHYNRDSGEPVAIQGHVHLLSDHVKAGLAAGLALQEMDERIVDEDCVAAKPKWKVFLGRPISFSMVWRG